MTEREEDNPAAKHAQERLATCRDHPASPALAPPDPYSVARTALTSPPAAWTTRAFGAPSAAVSKPTRVTVPAGGSRAATSVEDRGRKRLPGSSSRSCTVVTSGPSQPKAAITSPLAKRRRR